MIETQSPETRQVQERSFLTGVNQRKKQKISLCRVFDLKFNLIHLAQVILKVLVADNTSSMWNWTGNAKFTVYVLSIAETTYCVKEDVH